MIIDSIARRLIGHFLKVGNDENDKELQEIAQLKEDIENVNTRLKTRLDGGAS